MDTVLMEGKMNYKQAGVDVQAGEEAVRLIKPIVKATFTPNVLTDLGSFGALFKLDLHSWKHPVLVASTDGVGTKLLVAKMAREFSTVGQDLVNHCCNDIFVQGAIPQFFMDYIGVGELIPEKAKTIVEGLAKACFENGVALIGGEMAEMPGIYQRDDFDLVGTIVGLVEEEKIITGNEIERGDVVLGFPGTGLHTNGFSLARKILFDVANLTIDSLIPTMGVTVADALLKVHPSYYRTLKDIVAVNTIHGMAHITGGGIAGNIKRIIPSGKVAVINKNSWECPPLFSVLRELGNISEEAMFEAFNMGIGYIIVTSSTVASIVMKQTDCYHIGFIEESKDERKVLLV